MPGFSEKKPNPNLTLGPFSEKNYWKQARFLVYIILSIIILKVPQIPWLFRVILCDSEKKSSHL